MDSKFKQFIIALLRRGTQRWKPAQEALKDAKETYYIKSVMGKDLKRVKFKCAHCGLFYTRKEVCLDHIQPIVPVDIGFTNWDDYINRMFCPKEGFQTLCKQCHKIKTKLEGEQRKQFRKKRKEDGRK